MVTHKSHNIGLPWWFHSIWCGNVVLCPVMSIILFVWYVISSHLYVCWSQTFLSWSVDGLVLELVLDIMFCIRLILHVALIDYIPVICRVVNDGCFQSCPVILVLLVGCIQSTLFWYIDCLYPVHYVYYIGWLYPVLRWWTIPTI